MMTLAMSPAALGLLRALAARAGVPRDRILLTEWTSTDWQSLTFVGERHEACIRIIGADAADGASRLVSGIEDAELNVPGHVVADIRLWNGGEAPADGSVLLRLEALTVEE
jgi:hypothetical protein